MQVQVVPLKRSYSVQVYLADRFNHYHWEQVASYVNQSYARELMYELLDMPEIPLSMISKLYL